MTSVSMLRMALAQYTLVWPGHTCSIVLALSRISMVRRLDSCSSVIGDICIVLSTYAVSLVRLCIVSTYQASPVPSFLLDNDS